MSSQIDSPSFWLVLTLLTSTRLTVNKKCKLPVTENHDVAVCCLPASKVKLFSTKQDILSWWGDKVLNLFFEMLML